MCLCACQSRVILNHPESWSCLQILRHIFQWWLSIIFKKIQGSRLAVKLLLTCWEFGKEPSLNMAFELELNHIPKETPFVPHGGQRKVPNHSANQTNCDLQWFDSVFNDHSTTPIRALCLAALHISWVAIENKAHPQNGLCHYGRNVQSASFFAQGLAQCTLLAVFESQVNWSSLHSQVFWRALECPLHKSHQVVLRFLQSWSGVDRALNTW